MPASLWEALTGIKHLVLDDNEPLDTICSQLPSLLVSIRLRSPFDDAFSPRFEGLATALRTLPRSLRSLKKVILPHAEPAPNSTCSSEEFEGTREAVVALCQERGVEVVDRVRYDDSDYVAHLEDAIDFW